MFSQVSDMDAIESMRAEADSRTEAARVCAKVFARRDKTDSQATRPRVRRCAQWLGEGACDSPRVPDAPCHRVVDEASLEEDALVEGGSQRPAFSSMASPAESSHATSSTGSWGHACLSYHKDATVPFVMCHLL